MRKLIVFFALAILLAGGVAVAAWRIMDDGGDENTAVEGAEAVSFKSDLEETTSVEDAEAEGSTSSADSTAAADPGVAAEDIITGEDFSYTSPDQRYVTETQRHQNFFLAVAEGRVKRLEVIRADVRPVGDLNTSYIYFTLITDTGTSTGTFVMKYSGGIWRIAAINQLLGDLDGGTNYMVPASFEGTLRREIVNLQPFLTKVAEGRFAYMEVHAVNRPSESESILTGIVVGKSGVLVPAEMRLRKDYGIWHLTYITDPS